MAASITVPAGAELIGSKGGKRYWYDSGSNVWYTEAGGGSYGGGGGPINSIKEVPNGSNTERDLKIYFQDALKDKGYASDGDYLSAADSGPLRIPLPNTEGEGTGGVARYPNDIGKYDTHDYVLFQFANYQPPFKTNRDEGRRGANPGLGEYNESIDIEVADVIVKDISTNESVEVSSIILPMPQDLSNEQKQNWVGKKFTRLGADVIRATGGNFGNLKDTLGDTKGNLGAIVDALKASALNKIPGVGGNLSINDISGSTRGIVLNPNAELLYDSPDLREIGMVFKMVPQSQSEAVEIKKIVDAFRAASLPQYGSEQTVEGQDGKQISGDNWIRIPMLCKFTFMKGSDANPWVAQYKPCGIVQVQVNYTPDGTYAAYEGGSPVATELTIRFVETKLIFRKEIEAGF